MIQLNNNFSKNSTQKYQNYKTNNWKTSLFIILGLNILKVQLIPNFYSFNEISIKTVCVFGGYSQVYLKFTGKCKRFRRAKVILKKWDNMQGLYFRYYGLL